MNILLYPNAEPKNISYLELKKLGKIKIQGKILLIDNKVYGQIESMGE